MNLTIEAIRKLLSEVTPGDAEFIANAKPIIEFLLDRCEKEFQRAEGKEEMKRWFQEELVKKNLRYQAARNAFLMSTQSASAMDIKETEDYVAKEIQAELERLEKSK